MQGDGVLVCVMAMQILIFVATTSENAWYWIWHADVEAS